MKRAKQKEPKSDNQKAPKKTNQKALKSVNQQVPKKCQAERGSKCQPDHTKKVQPKSANCTFKFKSDSLSHIAFALLFKFLPVKNYFVTKFLLSEQIKTFNRHHN